MEKPTARTIFEEGEQPTVLKRLGHVLFAHLQTPYPSEHFTDSLPSSNGNDQVESQQTHAFPEGWD